MARSRRLLAVATVAVATALLSGCVFAPFFSDMFYDGPTGEPEFIDPDEFGVDPTVTPTERFGGSDPTGSPSPTETWR
ncbi:hypothetical protein [Gulosibacter faecalis]|jgi:hypothetical protein|uniref:Uncharacterized protein n=1 Tax=Gulosibacter faecalis TaxID=272240 RepID=A0ABW5UW87_9MICO|nr:hypothetical protein [Gulosibacter faecalis]